MGTRAARPRMLVDRADASIVAGLAGQFVMGFWNGGVLQNAILAKPVARIPRVSCESVGNFGIACFGGERRGAEFPRVGARAPRRKIALMVTKFLAPARARRAMLRENTMVLRCARRMGVGDFDHDDGSRVTILSGGWRPPRTNRYICTQSVYACFRGKSSCTRRS